MTALASVNQLVTVIRAQLSARAPAGAAARAARGEGVAAGRYAEQNLAGLIEARIRQIAQADPQRGRKAFRVFLEAVLLAHFGEELMHDPKFYQLLDDVQGALEADPGTALLVRDAIAQLLAS